MYLMCMFSLKEVLVLVDMVVDTVRAALAAELVIQGQVAQVDHLEVVEAVNLKLLLNQSDSVADAH